MSYIRKATVQWLSSSRTSNTSSTTSIDKMRAVSCLLQIFILGAFWVASNASAFYDVNSVDAMNSKLPFTSNEGVRQHLTRGIRARASCPEDYSPCTCEVLASGLKVDCDNVPIEQIQDVFYRTQTLDLAFVFLKPSMPTSGAMHLPANLLQNKRIKSIDFWCPYDANRKLALTLDPAAFQYTRFTTNRVYFQKCNLASQTDMRFLNDFSLLDTLMIFFVDNIECLSTLPTATLPALRVLAIPDGTGLQNVAFPDLTPASVERLDLSGNYLQNAVVNDILISVGSSSSANSLADFFLSGNALTAIPRLAAFSKLGWIDISNNAISFINRSSLVFSAPVRILNLRDNVVGAIEADAFQSGDYTMGAKVYLENNKLVEFREDVFKPMLQQMAATTGGVYVAGNPFDCGCSLAWLIRDNRALIQNVIGGVCGGFFKFEELNPDSYANC